VANPLMDRAQRRKWRWVFFYYPTHLASDS